MSLLEINGIKKSFGQTEVLKGIDFSLESGEVLAIIGQSGSGKTTLLRCLNFLEKPDEGTIRVNDDILFSSDEENQSEEKTREKRLHFGLVFQSFNLFPQYNALDNVLLALNLLTKEKSKERITGLKKVLKSTKDKEEKNLVKIKIKEENENLQNLKKENESLAKSLLKRVGLEDKMSSYPHELSGGQCQRVAIARALALKPDILCFDEPTSALDPELTGEVLKVIRELKTGDRTMIVVTHEMEFAKNVADKIIFMADGIIEEIGTSDEIFLNPKSPKTKAFLEKSLEFN